MKSGTSRVRIFENEYLEKLSLVHPIIPLVVWAPVILICLYRALISFELSSVLVLGLFLGGLFTWTFAEYCIHRFVFHYENPNPIWSRFQFIMHGNHHQAPQDAYRLVMPPVPAVLLASLFFMLFRLVLGDVWVFGFFPGFMFGYLCYDYTHFAVHFFRPKTGIGRWLKQVHMDHHYLNPESRFGVSSPLWDFVFGTLKKPVAAARVSTPSFGARTTLDE